MILVYAPERENTNKVIIVTSLFLLFFEIGEQMKKNKGEFSTEFTSLNQPFLKNLPFCNVIEESSRMSIYF